MKRICNIHYFKKCIVSLLYVAIVFTASTPAMAQISVPKITKPLFELSTKFDQNDFKWSLKKGTGVIAGQGYLRAPGGFIQTAVGETATLVPKTPYTDEIVAASRQDGFFDEYRNVKKHPDYNQFRRVQKTDKKGRFRFENLPAGDWYVVTRVIWYTRDQTGTVSLHGGLLWGQITLADGEIRNNIKLNTTQKLAK